MEVDEIRKLKKDLTVTPICHKEYPFATPFPVYEDRTSWIRIPRFFGMERYGEPDKISLLDQPLDEKSCTFSGSLRESQLEPHNVALKGLREKGTGLLCCPTGAGKSVTLLSLLSHLKQRTCILLHKSQLLQQWNSEIARFLPDLKVGIIQQKQKSFSENCDVYIIMIQTLLNMKEIPNIFGFTVIDECHHLSSSTFSQVLFKVNSKYILGLTATPERKDGLTKVIYWHIGDILYHQKPDRRGQSTTHVEVYNYSPGPGYNPRKYAEMVSKLCTSAERNSYIVDALAQQLAKDGENKRRVLILTERKGHAKDLRDTLDNIYGDVRPCGLLVGGLKKQVMEVEMEKHILVATYNLMSEGISIPCLNTILFATPKRDVVQALGRIFRKTHTDINPMIIDICDSMLKGQQAARLKTYKSELNGNIKVTYHSQDDIEEERMFY